MCSSCLIHKYEWIYTKIKKKPCTKRTNNIYLFLLHTLYVCRRPATSLSNFIVHTCSYKYFAFSKLLPRAMYNVPSEKSINRNKKERRTNTSVEWASRKTSTLFSWKKWCPAITQVSFEVAFNDATLVKSKHTELHYTVKGTQPSYK